MNAVSGWSRRRLLKGMATSVALAAAPGRFAVGATGKPDVLVIGAGLSGLNAALNLQDVGLHARVLEGSNRIGGRLFTAPEELVPGHPEIGGSGIGAHYARILYVAKRFGVALSASRPRTEARAGEVMYHVRGSAILPDDWAKHPLNPFTRENFRKTPLHLFQYSIYGEDNPLPTGDLSAWQDRKYPEFDISVYDYLLSKGVNPQAIRLATGTNMSYGSNPHDLSALMGFQSSNLVRSLYRGDNAFSGGAKAAVGGNQRIPEAMARGLDTEIVFDQHVRTIQSMASGVSVVTASGERHSAKYCICTLPFSAVRHVHVEPGFEGVQAEAVHELGYTPVFEVHFVPTKPYWEIDGMPPSMWTDQTPGRFMALRNDPANPDSITSCLAFVNGEMAQYLDRLNPNKAAELVLSDLARMRPATKDALETRMVFSWNRTPFAGGAYAYWKPGQITRFAVAMRKPVARIHFAGEHTAVVNRGMEGAMESGERAAFEVITRLG